MSQKVAMQLDPDHDVWESMRRMGNVVTVDTKRIRYRKKELRITDEVIAKETGLSKSYVRHLIAGYVPEIWQPRFEAIARVLKLPVKEIATEQGRKRA